MEISLHQVPGHYWVGQATVVDPGVVAFVAETSPHFWSISTTPTEVSIVSEVEKHDSFHASEGPFVAFAVAGRLDFSLTGILSRCSGLLADGGVSVFCVSTFDTDYFLVREQSLDEAVALWRAGGIGVEEVSDEPRAS